MKTLRPLNTLLLSLSLSASLLTPQLLIAQENPSAIRMINSHNFSIDQGEIEAIKAQMQDAVDAGFLAGALLMVGNRDGVGMLESVGYRKQGSQDPVNKDTLFRIYSMTKPIVSVAAMSMVEDGLLSLEDPVSKYIPEFNDLEVIDRETGATSKASNVMTVKNLLTQESGLIQEIFSPDSALGKMYQQNIPGDGSMTARQIAGRLGSMPVYFEPGTAWHYGHSTDVLGAVLEVAAGKTLDTILQERIFDPLGMDDTSFYVPPGKAFRIAEPIYGEMADNTVARPFLSAGGGLNSTTEDYTRFAEMLLNGGEYRGNRIIDKTTLTRMTEPYITDDVSREFYFYGDRGNWGLGFHLQPVDGNNANGPHNFGWRGIGGTIFIVDPANDFYMIYMEQRRGGPRGAPFDNNAAQRVIYEAMAD